MSFSAVRPYIQAVFGTLYPDRAEWKDAFNIDNIPNPVLTKTYHITFGDYSGQGQNQTRLYYKVPITVEFWLKGFKNPSQAIDNANIAAENFIKEMLKASRRLVQAGIKNVESDRIKLEPIAQTNDNIVLLKMDFSFLVLMDIS